MDHSTSTDGFAHDPVFYHGGAPDPEGKPMAPGWYFYDETWAHAYGPHPDEAAARSALRTYCEVYLGIDGRHH